MDHVSMLMGYHKHKINISREVLFNERDLKLVIRSLIKDNDGKVFAMVVMFSNHTVCLGWDGKNLESVNHDKIKNAIDFTRVIKNTKICEYEQQVSGEKETKAAANVVIFERYNDKLILNSIDSIELTIENAEKASLLLYYGMRVNKTQDIEACIKEIINSQLPLKNTRFLLKAAYLEVPVLSSALQDNMTESVKEFTKVILKSNLGDNIKLELLSAKQGDETPGLYMAFQEGHTEIFTAFIELILGSQLSDGIKLELLSAKQDNETSGLYMALQNAHKETVKVFSQMILDSNLDDYTKSQLLSAKLGDGTPRLFVEFYQGHKENVIAFTQLILNSNLNNKPKLQLLSAQDRNKTPGLLISLERGHAKTVNAFIKLILDSDLDDESELKMMCQNIQRQMDDSNSSKK